jgi:hypothetical protein
MPPRAELDEAAQIVAISGDRVAAHSTLVREVR